MAPFELQVEKKWTAAWSQKNLEKGEQIVTMDMRITAFEKIHTELGEFNAFRIEGRGWAGGYKQNTELERRIWIIPGINFIIRVERINRDLKGHLKRTERVNLIYLRQQNIDSSPW